MAEDRNVQKTAATSERNDAVGPGDLQGRVSALEAALDEVRDAVASLGASIKKLRDYLSRG